MPRRIKRNRIFYLSNSNKIYEVENKNQIPANAIITVMARDPSDANRTINKKLERRNNFNSDKGQAEKK